VRCESLFASLDKQTIGQYIQIWYLCWICKVSLLLLHRAVCVENAENVSEKSLVICAVERQTILSLVH
jgi:hypothetical protein